MPPSRPSDWHAMPLPAVSEALDAGPDGLTAQEAAARLARYGRYWLPRRRRPGVLLLYLRQFRNPLVYLLLAATVVSLAIGELTDAIFIFVVLQFNASVGTA